MNHNSVGLSWQHITINNHDVEGVYIATIFINSDDVSGGLPLQLFKYMYTVITYTLSGLKELTNTMVSDES